MKLRALSAISGLAVLTSAGLLIAGPLSPPAGPVASTSKTLTEVEPRIAINATNTPGDVDSVFTIAQPGSYYLTGNLTGVTNKVGIKVAADNVTIDLGGFVMTGAPTSLACIFAGGGFDGTTVRNGTITGWGGGGVNLRTNVTLVGLNVLGSLNSGIVVDAGGLIDSCISTGNANNGISAKDNSIIRGCISSGNLQRGINGFGVIRVERTVASDNTSDGIFLGNFGVARECTANANGAAGFRTNNLANISDCNSYDNAGAGFAVADGVVVTGCTATSNQGPGIEAFGSCRLENNTCRLNGLGTTQHAGIRIIGNRTVAMNNTTSGNIWGIKVEGTLCLIKGNTSTSNTLTNFEIVAGNRVASIVNLATSGAVSGNSGGTPVADSDANFVY